MSDDPVHEAARRHRYDDACGCDECQMARLRADIAARDRAAGRIEAAWRVLLSPVEAERTGPTTLRLLAHEAAKALIVPCKPND